MRGDCARKIFSASVKTVLVGAHSKAEVDEILEKS